MRKLKDIGTLLKWKWFRFRMGANYRAYMKGKKSITVTMFNDPCADKMHKGFTRILRIGYNLRNAEFIRGGVNPDGIQYGVYDIHKEIQNFSMDTFCNLFYAVQIGNIKGFELSITNTLAH